MKTDALRTISENLDEIDKAATMMYYNNESPAIAAGLIKRAVQDARKALYTATVEEMIDDDLFPLLPDQVEAEKTDGRVF